jgi:3-oxoacid CoA-transferase subunit A
MFLPGIDQSTVDNSAEEWLDAIENRLTYDRWYCGHWNTSKTIDKLRFLFEDFLELR